MILARLVYPLMVLVVAAAPAAFAADAPGPATVPGPAPQALMEQVSQDLLRDLDANRAAYRQNPKKLRALVDKFLLPNFDTEFAARRVLGKHWTTATSDQRQRFIDAFVGSLMGDYGDYGGGPRERDAGYHQGPVWGWFLGPFALAHFRVYKDAEAARSFLAPMAHHLADCGVGSLAEIFDGDRRSPLVGVSLRRGVWRRRCGPGSISPQGRHRCEQRRVGKRGERLSLVARRLNRP